MLVAPATQAAWLIMVHHVLHDTPLDKQSQPVSLHNVISQQAHMSKVCSYGADTSFNAQRKTSLAAGGITQVPLPPPP